MDDRDGFADGYYISRVSPASLLVLTTIIEEFHNVDRNSVSYLRGAVVFVLDRTSLLLINACKEIVYS